MRQFLQDVAAVRKSADGDDDHPGLKWIQVIGAEIAVRQYRQDHEGQQKKLREGEDFGCGDAIGETFEKSLQLKQQHAQNRERRSDPEMIARDQRANEVGREAGYLCGHTGHRLRLELVPIGEPEERADHRKSGRDQAPAIAGEQAHGVANQTDQRKRAYTAESIALGNPAAFFAL